MSEPRSRFHRLLDGDITSPMRGHAGLAFAEHGPGRLTEVMTVPHWLREPSGAPSFAALVVLADSTLAASVSTRLADDHAPVTQWLHTVALGDLTPRARRLVACASVLQFAGSHALTRCEIVDDTDALVATATMRVAVIAEPADTTRVAEQTSVPDPAEPTALDEAIRLDVTAWTDDRRLRTKAIPALANSIGTLHGGAVAAIGARAAGAIVDMERRSAQGVPSRPASIGDLFVDYLRPIPADGSIVEVRANVAHAARSRTIVQAVLHRIDASPAALVRAEASPR